MEELELELEGKGKFVATKSPDPDYPGLNIDFIPKVDDYEENACLPGVRMEYDKETGKLKIYVWADKEIEDPSQIIVVNHKI